MMKFLNGIGIIFILCSTNLADTIITDSKGEESFVKLVSSGKITYIPSDRQQQIKEPIICNVATKPSEGYINKPLNGYIKKKQSDINLRCPNVTFGRSSGATYTYTSTPVYVKGYMRTSKSGKTSYVKPYTRSRPHSRR